MDPGEMAQRVGAMTAPPETPTLSPCVHMAACNLSVTSVTGYIIPSSGIRGQIHTHTKSWKLFKGAVDSKPGRCVFPLTNEEALVEWRALERSLAFTGKVLDHPAGAYDGTDLKIDAFSFSRSSTSRSELPNLPDAATLEYNFSGCGAPRP